MRYDPKVAAAALDPNSTGRSVRHDHVISGGNTQHFLLVQPFSAKRLPVGVPASSERRVNVEQINGARQFAEERSRYSEIVRYRRRDKTWKINLCRRHDRRTREPATSKGAVRTFRASPRPLPLRSFRRTPKPHDGGAADSVALRKILWEKSGDLPSDTLVRPVTRLVQGLKAVARDVPVGVAIEHRFSGEIIHREIFRAAPVVQQNRIAVSTPHRHCPNVFGIVPR